MSQGIEKVTQAQYAELVYCLEKALEARYGGKDDSWVTTAERLLETLPRVCVGSNA